LILKCNQKDFPSFSRKNPIYRVRKNIIHYVCTRSIGRVAERLGRGLQNLVQQFESARDLNKNVPVPLRGTGIFVFVTMQVYLQMGNKNKKHLPSQRLGKGGFVGGAPRSRVLLVGLALCSRPQQNPLIQRS
jgi:hypothetical protein